MLKYLSDDPLRTIFNFISPFTLIDDVRFVCKKWNKLVTDVLRSFIKDNKKIFDALLCFYEQTASEANLLKYGFPTIIGGGTSLRGPSLLISYKDADYLPLKHGAGYERSDVLYFWYQVIDLLEVGSWNSFISLFTSLVQQSRYFLRFTISKNWDRYLTATRQDGCTKRKRDEAEDKEPIETDVFIERSRMLTVVFPIRSLKQVQKRSRYLWLEGSDHLICRMENIKCLLYANGKAVIILSGKKDCDTFSKDFLQDLEEEEEEEENQRKVKSLFILKSMFEDKYDASELIKLGGTSLIGPDEHFFKLRMIFARLSDFMKYGLAWGQRNLNEGENLDPILPRKHTYYIEAVKIGKKRTTKYNIWSLILYDVLRNLDLWTLLTKNSIKDGSCFSVETIVSIIPQLIGCKTIAKKWEPFIDPWLKPLEQKEEKEEKELPQYVPPSVLNIVAVYKFSGGIPDGIRHNNKDLYTETRDVGYFFRLKNDEERGILCWNTDTITLMGGKSLADYSDLLEAVKKSFK